MTGLRFTILLAVLTSAYSAVACRANERLHSPDERLQVEFELLADGVPAYRVTRGDETLIDTSRLGLEPDFLQGFELTSVLRDEHASQWHNSFGERSEVPDNYRDLHCDLTNTAGQKLRITFRAYNEGVALRYTLPEQERKEFNFTGERTEFCFPENVHAYEEHGTEGEYHRVLVKDILPFCERPLTLEYPTGTHAALSEAANFNYPRMLLSPGGERLGSLVSALGGKTSNTEAPSQRHDPSVKLAAGESTPWRVLIVGDRPADLLERNYLILNLSPPCALTDTSWIKPGKVMRDPTLTTKVSKEIIDFAETAGLSYVHLDAGWYGPDRDPKSDAMWVGPKRAAELDVEEIIRYGKEKGVGVLVYVDHSALVRQLDELLPHYEQWGLKGIKFGFVRVGPQSETAWITDALKKSAEHHLMINIHDGFRATGLQRTFPNLMTVEGIRGNERMPTAAHNCTLPFTRYLTGMGDYTVCYYNNRIQTTHAHQLAMNVISFSPLQWVFWYDKPEFYRGEAEVEFFREVPTVWDETKVIHGEIGQYATIARRKGDAWFVGTINGAEPRTLEIPLDFLAADQDYDATTYSDDENLDTRTKVRINQHSVTHETTFTVPLQATGGQAIWIRPHEEAKPRHVGEVKRDDFERTHNRDRLTSSFSVAK